MPHARTVQRDEGMPHRWSVIIADDHPIVLRGVDDILAQAGDFEVVATAASRAEFLDACARCAPDIAVLDLRLGEILAPDLMEILCARHPGVLVVILTAFADASLLEACMARGARGVLLKEASGLDLVAALRSVAGGEIVLDPRLQTSRASRQEKERFQEGGFNPHSPSKSLISLS
jgi:DNA-binding NarL/FixJ family response regulator